MALASELTGPFAPGQATAIGGQGTTGITAAGTNSQANSTFDLATTVSGVFKFVSSTVIIGNRSA